MMSSELFNFSTPALPRDPASRTEYLHIQRPLKRVLAFTGRTIDDVVNSRIAKNQVTGYYKLYRQVQRRSEIVELENHWNGV
jgi:hypothetical protein